MGATCRDILRFEVALRTFVHVDRQRFPEPFKSPRHSVSLDGFSLHAGVRIHANDLQGRERLCR